MGPSDHAAASSPPLPPRGILESVLYVADLDAAERFYTDVVGLSVISRTPGRSVALRCHHDVLLLFDPRATEVQRIEVEGSPIPAHGARGAGHVAFTVTHAEIPLWRTRLERLGVPIESQVAWPGGAASIYLRDPAGNSVEFVTADLWDRRRGAGPPHSPHPAVQPAESALSRWSNEGGNGSLHRTPPLAPGRARDLIELLGLAPHPEGGWYREVFRSQRSVIADADRGRRSGLTTIHFLLGPGEHSRWHRVASDEVWHVVEGGPLELLEADPDLREVRRRELGPVTATRRSDHVVPAHHWQAARPLGEYALCTCTVGPGFDFEDFEFLAGDAEAAARLRVVAAEYAELL